VGESGGRIPCLRGDLKNNERLLKNKLAECRGTRTEMWEGRVGAVAQRVETMKSCARTVTDA